MKVIEPGHAYELAVLDRTGDEQAEAQILLFVKRVGPAYPGNTGPAHPGVTIQEVLRAVMDRFRYVDRQEPCRENSEAIAKLESVLWDLEKRAAVRNGLSLVDRGRAAAFFDREKPTPMEAWPTCPTCGHWVCHHGRR